MNILLKFFSKLIKKDGFIFVTPNKRKIIIGKPEKNIPLEVKFSKNVSQLKCVAHSDKWIPEYIISEDITFDKGTLEDFISICIKNKGRGNINFFNNFISKSISFYRKLFSLNTTKRNKKSVSFHYDIPSQVYKYMLGETMMYSCAYWDKGGPGMQTLDDAQYSKINFLKKKLRLTEKDTLLDIGFGNGTFILKCAEQYNIPMYGVSLSEEQTKVAKEAQIKKSLGHNEEK